MAQTTIPAGVQNTLSRLSLMDGMSVNITRTQLSKIPNIDTNEAVWHKGCSFTMPSLEVLEASLFSQKLGTREIPGVVVETSEGIKQLYFSTLKKSVQPTDEFGKAIPGKERVHSDGNMYTPVCNCANADKILEYLGSLAGKTVTVTNVAEVQTAAYNDNREIIGSRVTNVPFFNVA